MAPWNYFLLVPTEISPGIGIPRDSFSGIPFCFLWHLRINSFYRPLRSSLKFFPWHLGINSFWRQLGSPMWFGIPGDSFSGFLFSFTRWGLLCLSVHRELHIYPLGFYYTSLFLGNYLHLGPIRGYQKMRSLSSCSSCSLVNGSSSFSRKDLYNPVKLCDSLETAEDIYDNLVEITHTSKKLIRSVLGTKNLSRLAQGQIMPRNP